MVIAFDVLGSPAPKGSGRSMLIGGQARFIGGGSSVNARKLKSWDTALREAARNALDVPGAPNLVALPFIGVSLRVALTFRLVRPGGHWGKRGMKRSAPLWPIVKPDLDKLVRATLDTLTGVLWDDDSRVVELVARKVYAAPGAEGARIEVEALT
mgnify:CR=1 FL=1